MEITKVSTAPPQRSERDEPPAEPSIGWAEALGQDVENPPTARTHGHQLFEPDGKTHTVATCENRIKGQFELWVRNNALRAIAQIEESDPDTADQMRSIYLADCGAGHYTWDGKHVRHARFKSIPGMSYLIYLLMARCDPKKTEEQVASLLRKYPAQCGQLLGWALGNSPSPEGTGGSNNINGTVNQNR